MSLIVPYSAPPSRPFQWTINSSIQLICERRNANSQFVQLRNSGHHAVWSSIANNIFNTTGLVVTPNQCRTKWNSLKRGYENLIRIMSDNRRGYPLSSPNSFDEARQFIYIIYCILGGPRRRYRQLNAASDLTSIRISISVKVST